MSTHSAAAAVRSLATARQRVGIAVGIGLAGALTIGAFGSWWLAPICGWDVAAAVYVLWMWLSIGHLDAAKTAALAGREDPGRAAADGLLVIASLASLAVVGLVLVWAHAQSGPQRTELVALLVLSVILSWLVVHTVFTLRYAQIYYTNHGGINFNQSEDPRYADFAYMAFTVGMTFQVSDTNITSSEIRSTILRQALLSYLFGTVIVASTINLLAGLGQ